MKIINLKASNVKRLKAIEITPDGSTVIIGGRNNQGKSSVLDAIRMALGGKKAQPPEPVRRGEESASVVATLDDLVVTRKIKADGKTSLTVTGTDGRKYQSPQQVLDKLFADCTFDPLEFMRAPPKAQHATLAEIAGLDLVKWGEQHGQIYDKRRDVNRDLKAAQAKLSGMSYADSVAGRPVSVKKLLAELKKRREQRQRKDNASAEVERLRSEGAKLVQDIQQFEAELARKKARLERVKAKGASWVADLKAMPYPDLAEIEGEIEDAEEVNALITSNARYDEQREQVAALEKQSSQLSGELDAIEQMRAKEVKTAVFPVEGLGLTNDGVTFSDLPLEQASQSEQLRVSVAVGLALNPQLRVLLVRDGSVLDQESLAELTRLAEIEQAQLWIERVGDDGGCTVVIEDGEAKK